MKRLGLCMIVKIEAHIIRRCLTAVRPLIASALIVDTGSTDSTIAEIQDFCASSGLDGTVLSEPWSDFATNRSSALAHMRKRQDVDYALMIDADDEVVFAEGLSPAAFKSGLDCDVVNIWTHTGGYTYKRPQLFSNRKPFEFKGVLHEFLDCPEPFSQTSTEAFYCVAKQDSARNELSDKYARDALVLARALERESDPFLRSRYTFYLAQGWRDCGEHAKAYPLYIERPEQGFWEQEVYLSLVYAGQMAEALGRDSSAALDLYLRAFEVCPGRAEALHAAARLCRIKSRFHTGYCLAKTGLAISRPADGLFLADWIYQYGMADECAILAYWSGRHEECQRLCEDLLKLSSLSASDRQRIEDNRDHARKAIAAAKT